MASAQPRKPHLPEPPAPSLESLTDDLIEAILIRLPALADLGRAAAACPAFRRVIADHAFRRRVRALHPPLLLGFLTATGGFRPAQPPYPSAPAARAVARAADLLYSFLPSPAGWVVRDARDGRVLLDRRDEGDCVFAKLAVCDPLFRRYVVLPPIPDNLAAAVQQPRVLDLARKFEVFLVPSLQEEAAAQASFRVVWMAQCPTELVTFVFSSVSWQWHAIASPAWHDPNPALFARSYAYGCFYWLWIPMSANFLVLDMARMEFSLLKIPSGHPRKASAVVEAGQGRLGIFAFSDLFGELDIFSTNRPNQGEGAIEWKKRTVAMWPYKILGVASGRLLQRYLDFDEDEKVDVLSIDLNADHERVCGMINEFLHPLPLIGYPPSLSSPSI